MYEVASSFGFQDMTNLIKDNEDLILGKFAYDENIPSQVFLQNMTKHLKDLMCKDILRLALLDVNRTMNGVILIERSGWDSEHFGINVGNLKLALFNREVDIKSRRYLFQKIKDLATSRDLSVIFARIALSDMLTIHSLEREGAMLTDILLTFYIDLKHELVPLMSSSTADVVEANERDKQVLMEIARRCFKIDHFHADSYLPRGKCDELYAKWISSCLNGLVDAVLVANKGGKPIGFITCKVERIINGYSYGIIDLVGVKKEHESKGVGSLLVAEALRWFSSRTKSVYVGTQAANIPALRLYKKAGFTQVFSEATLHLWIS